ncbi:hypothetical protein BaRGS_00015177 [Batillaria attramentaria]|uniref:Uncharacterized protein n=1 Tax=Batillaria attramentaria TaxID=370345 RepID=A0ABD0L2V4_9CAEN
MAFLKDGGTMPVIVCTVCMGAAVSQRSPTPLEGHHYAGAKCQDFECTGLVHGRCIDGLCICNDEYYNPGTEHRENGLCIDR